ncbi:hypothetical protein [Parapedobacter sp. 2B3]|uniref:hypothetical protein n=1 Tax=Parapedobacter sp. 2B3 TaxID=3342381 RepID=UPI0035B660A5
MEKQYLLDGLPVQVTFADGLVRIVNDQPFKQAVTGQPEGNTTALVAKIKSDYKASFGNGLAIGDDSFVMEILGHLYFDYLLLRYKSLLRFICVFGLYDRFCRSCRVIDCGERGKDPNRWLWNKLVPFQKLLARRLGNVRLSRFTEG